MDSNALMLQHYLILYKIMTETALGIGTLQNSSLLQKNQTQKRRWFIHTFKHLLWKWFMSTAQYELKLQLRIYVCHLSQHASFQICYLSTLLFIKLVWPNPPKCDPDDKLCGYQALKWQNTCWGKKKKADE